MASIVILAWDIVMFDKADYSSLIKELIQSYTDETNIDIIAAPLQYKGKNEAGYQVFQLNIPLN